VTKDEAQREVLRRWRELPIMSRQTYAQAVQFAKTLVGAMQFETLANRDRLVEAWLVRDLQNRDLALRTVDRRAAESMQKSKIVELAGRR
jgi:hypothetical protein